MITPRQVEVAKLYAEGYSQRQIAEKLGITRSTLCDHIRGAKNSGLIPKLRIPPLAPPTPDGFEVRQLTTRLNAAGDVRSQSVQVRPEGDIPDPENVVPAGHVVKGISTLLGDDGSVRAQWVKTSLDEEAREAAQAAAFRALCETLPPIDLIAGPSYPYKGDMLCTQYTLTDSHVGMLAWGREAGEPWDLVIAERVLTETLIRMIDAAPESVLGIVNQLGDFLHFDSLKPLTPEHGNILDADSRYQKIVEVAVRILRRVIEHALTKHHLVHVYMHEGNHDPTGSVWLRVMMAQLYENNPRVTVEQSPLPYVAMQWGKTMLAYHHGHLAKNVNLPLIFAERFAKMWGDTTYRYVHTGHKHEVSEKEHPGMKWIQHPTLAAPDAYAARGGWLSKRQATSMTYHKEKGEIARGIFIPE